MPTAYDSTGEPVEISRAQSGAVEELRHFLETEFMSSHSLNLDEMLVVLDVVQGGMWASLFPGDVFSTEEVNDMLPD